MGGSSPLVVLEEEKLKKTLKFEVPQGSEAQQLLAELTTDYTLKSEPSTLTEERFYDTFDWRLFNHALALSVSGHELCLSQLSSDKIVQRAEISEPPTFAWDCSSETFKETLASVIEARALLKLAEVRVRTSPYRLLNKKNKTVAWIGYEAVEQPQHQDNALLVAYVWLRPVKGYPKHSRGLTQRCQALGLTQVSPIEVYQHILVGDGKQPGDYSTKLRFQFEPEMRSDEAAKTLLRFLLMIMQRNEPMIKQDIDTEFLHDFRVAMRRTRTALSQIKGVFPGEKTAHFRQAFKQIGQMSNELRDLDVYLLSQERYKALLPASLDADIDPLFDYLSRKRTQALKGVIQALNQPGYSETLEAWETFLSAPPSDDPSAPNAGRPIKALAQERIYKSYKRMVKLGNQILENTEDDKLHTLRIEGKKLRYLMEFFAHLFPPQEMNDLIKQLKELQEILGDFSDLGVQETYLLQVAEEMPLPQPQSRRVFLSIGALVEALAREREAVRASFATTFVNFAAPANRKAMRALFATKK